MKTLLIISTKNLSTEGIILCFNQPVALNNNLKTDEWWVSWDKIGKALCKGKYAKPEDFEYLRKEI